MKTAFFIWREMIGEAAGLSSQERVPGFGVRSGGPAFVGASFLCDVSVFFGAIDTENH